MKTTSARSIVAPIFSLLLAGSRLAGAHRDRITATHDDTTFLVDRYHDGRGNPYSVTFTGTFESVYKFDSGGSVTEFKADGETYTVSYRRNGKIKKVSDTTSSGERRYLAAADGGDIDGGGRGGVDSADGGSLKKREEREQQREHQLPAPSGRTNSRRLYDCEDCEQTWDVLCDGGVNTVCNLEDYGSPLRPTADLSIRLFCDNFSSVCTKFSGSEVCDGVCDEEEECLPPFTITLEWSGVAGSEGDDLSGALDLYVIEPSGETVYWNNWQSTIGGLSTDGYSMTYTVFEGLETTSSPTSVLGSSPCSSVSGTESEGMELVDASGQYIAFAEWWRGEAPIYWTMTATTGYGEVLTVTDGQFTGDCASSTTSAESITYSGVEYAHGVSKLVYLPLSWYVDNQCDVDVSF